MPLASLMEAWLKILESTGIFDAMDRGEDAVIHLLADDIDGALQTFIPAYAVAVSACQTVTTASVGIVDCEGERLKLRDTGLKALLEATGIMKIIRLVIKAWKAVPAAIRDIAVAALNVVGDVVDIFKHPSIASVIKLGADAAQFVMKYGKTIWKAAMATVKVVSKIGKFLYKWASKATEAVEGVLREVGLGPVADIISGKPIEALLEGIKETGKDAAAAWNDFKSGNIAGGIGHVAEAGVDIIGATLPWNW